MRLLLAAFLKGCIAGCVLFAAGYAVFVATGVRPRQHTAQAQTAPPPTATPTRTAQDLDALNQQTWATAIAGIQANVDAQATITARQEQLLDRSQQDEDFLLTNIGAVHQPFTHSVDGLDRTANSLEGTEASLSASSQAVLQAATMLIGPATFEYCLWLQGMLSHPAMLEAGIGVWTATIVMEQPVNDGQSCKAVLGPQSIY